MFSNCSGPCCTCACAGGCLAGHGDDDYVPANKESVIHRLDTDDYKNYREEMIQYLKTAFNYDYVPPNETV